MARKKRTSTVSLRKSRSNHRVPAQTETDVKSCTAAFDKRDDLHSSYKVNARILFALEARFNITDIHSVAAESLTDGYNDKKADLIFIDRDRKIAVIAQGCDSKETKREASANKAGDLTIAANWVLGEAIGNVPIQIRSATSDLRAALDNNELKELQFWYVHNCWDSANVKEELNVAEKSARRALSRKWKNVTLTMLEVGLEQQAEWYLSRRNPIRVASNFKFVVPGGYEVSNKKSPGSWSAAVTSIKLAKLQEIFLEHRDSLFSANIRSYLGSRDTDENINSGIKKSAKYSPDSFWVFNNGLTVLVNDYKFNRGKSKLEVFGMSVVNGAQTTGAIGNLASTLDLDAMVQVRFIKSTNTKVLNGIVRYNNSQNKVTNADYRSNDKTQQRLRKKFGEDLPFLKYFGARRGGDEDAMARPKNVLPSDTVAQALTAFHGDPNTAYFRKGKIWDDNEIYAKIFHEGLTPKHIIFVFGLLRAIEARRNIFRDKKKLKNLKEVDQEAHDFLSKRGAIFLLVSAVARCLETICGETIGNKFHLEFRHKGRSIQYTQKLWEPVVTALIPLSPDTLTPALEARLREKETDIAIRRFSSFVESTKVGCSSIYSSFASKVKGF